MKELFEKLSLRQSSYSQLSLEKKYTELLILADNQFFSDGLLLPLISSSTRPILVDPGLHAQLDNLSSTNKFVFVRESLLEKIRIIPGFQYITERNFSKERTTYLAEYLGFMTSGTEGKPNIIWKSSNNLLSEVDVLKDLFAVNSSSRFLSSITTCHIYGFLWAYLLPQLYAKEVVSAGSLSSALKELSKGYDFWISSAPVLEAFKKTGEWQRNEVYANNIISSASVLNPDIAKYYESKPRVSVFEIYGSTETGGIAYRRTALHDSFIPFPKVKLSRKYTGNLCVKSSYVSEYSQRGEKQICIQDEDQFYEMGDWVELSPDGMRYKGRLDRLVKIKGKRIHLDELEILYYKDFNIKEKPICLFYKEELYLIIKRPGIPKSSFIAIIENNFPNYLKPTKIYYISYIPLLKDSKLDYKRIEKFLQKKLSGRQFI